jgi:predicted DNA-binding transcriptional regulator AlpA
MQGIVLISPREVHRRTSLSPREQTRRAQQGRFPMPVKIGAGTNGRIAYVEAEIEEFNARCVAERDRGGAERLAERNRGGGA